MAAEIKRTEQEFRRFQIQWILEYTGGNKKKAAQLLGVSRKTFYRMLEEPEG